MPTAPLQQKEEPDITMQMVQEPKLVAGPKALQAKLASTKRGIENRLTGSLLEIRPMSIDKLQGLNIKMATVDEWLSSDDVKEDVIGALEQGAAKVQDYLIVAISSEGTSRNGVGDSIKMGVNLTEQPE